MTHTYYLLLKKECHIQFILIISYYFIDDEEEEPCDDIKDMSSQSAEIGVVKVFNVLLIHFLTVRKQSLPLGKALSVKCRSLRNC